MSFNLPIIDMEFGTAQLSGNQGLFVELLSRFKAQYSAAHSHLSSLIEQSAAEDARIYAHTIKGVCANLGLMALNDASRQLELAFKQGSSATAPMAFFSQTLKETIEQISQLENKAETTKGGQQSAHETLRTMLDNNQFIAPDTLVSLLSELTCDEQLKRKLHKAIDDLEYPIALDLLQQINN